MLDDRRESAEQWLDLASTGVLSRRGFLERAAALGLVGLVGAPAIAAAVAAGDNQRMQRAGLARSFDYVLVGAGAAGCVLARRLVDAGASVLLIEAGGSDEQPSIVDPGVWFTNIGGPNDWGHTTPPQAALNGRSLLIATGKVLGGGSSINGSLWKRGSAWDFDHWASLGATGWSFADVLPVYKAIEDWEGGANEWRGAGGLHHVRLPVDPHPAAVAWIEAAREMGLPIRADLNGETLEGAGYCNLSIRADGTRSSASRAYLRPVLDRPNITLLLGTLVTRLVWQDGRCVGVEIASGTDTSVIRAEQEVCVAAGAIGTAHLLQRSGVGSADALRKFGIDPVVDLLGVGENLQDHPLLEGVILEYKGDMPPPRNNAAEATLFHRSRADLPGPDLQPVLIELPVITPALRRRWGNVPGNGFTIAPGLVRPQSRGTVKLASSDPREKPIVDPAFLREEADVVACMRATELCRELATQKAFRDISTGEVLPGRPLDAESLRQFVRESVTSYFHPAGTCRMGNDTFAVVDPELRVRGTRGLRVCDSSVMPTIPTGNTCAASMLIGEKAAHFLLASATAGAKST